MLSKDYLLRQIEMLSQLVVRILRMREEGDENGASDEIEQNYHELFGLDPRLISLLPSEFLFDKIRSGEYLDADKGITLAILLREDAANRFAQGDSVEHYQRLSRSLKVYLAIALEHQVLPEQAHLYDLSGVLSQMAEYELSPDIKYDLFHYYEDAGEYAQAEDQLRELIDASGDNTEMVQEGISFYKWLLTLPDVELQAGNLPRSEVEEGLAQLQTV